MNGAVQGAMVALALACAGCAGFDASASGGGHGQYPGGDGPPRAGSPGQRPPAVVRCESRDNRRNYCAADTGEGMRLVRQLSSADCVQGSTWGYDARGVWVVSGCGGEFASAAGQAPAWPDGPGYDQRPGQDNGQIVRCESRGNHRRRCNAVIERDAQLIQQLSSTRCVQRQNWGWDRRGIWVSGGCGAEFQIR